MIYYPTRDRITVVLTSEEKTALRSKVKQSGKNLSTFVRALILDEIAA